MAERLEKDKFPWPHDEDAGIADETITIKEYTRKKSGRKQLSEDLFSEEVIHDITEIEMDQISSTG